MKKYLDEVEKYLKESKFRLTKENCDLLKSYMRSSMPFVGLKVPEQRKIFRQGYSFSQEQLSQQLAYWDFIWKQGNYFETLSQCLYFSEVYSKKNSLTELWDIIQHWVNRIENWAHSDGLSSIYSQILEKHEILIYPQLKTWNNSSNPWKCRQSLVSLLYYARCRKKVLAAKKIFPLISNLLEHPNYYVQKGVGWTLREVGQIYPEEAWTFLLKNATKISPTAFTACVEKRSLDEKNQLKTLRKF